jgi:hypothetical protein
MGFFADLVSSSHQRLMVCLCKFKQTGLFKIFPRGSSTDLVEAMLPDKIVSLIGYSRSQEFPSISKTTSVLGEEEEDTLCCF